MTVTTALYRRYRPDSFSDVIGQEHVTEPLMTALRKNRVNHAYLFSGPRGCGKTTSARILARCLNCVEGPTDTPCGKCPSCIELARGGSGSLDVIEIDAASHGGVDDARDLRERATFAPVRDRYKIFIIDEAHMVTSAGFNALLKIVEEPPEHIKFIFATTEPDKVIGTIRSRTHHYPFRLVPPEPLLKYLEQLCARENVPVAPGVLSLVIRAGGGSVRDSLSVLDQLMAGAGPNGLDYELAVALLGYTHASLLDDVVEAIAASDSATVFRAVDRVIQTGHDPRRFVEDLLERFRDLIIVKAMPDTAQAILRGVPADQIARMRAQANGLGSAELSRAADVTNTALTEMTGATSPRLHLELLCARILLPSAEQSERGIAARIDRVERRLNFAGSDAVLPSAANPPAEVSTTHPAQPPAPVPAPKETASESPVDTTRREQITAPRVSTNDWPEEDRSAQPSPPANGQSAVQRQSARQEPGPERQQAASPQPGAARPAPTGSPAGGDVEVLRRAWPEILQTLAKIKRSTWALVEPNAQVAGFDGQVLSLAFSTTGLAGAFGRADHSDNLRQAIHKTIGIDCQINAVAGSNSPASSEPNPKAPTSPAVPSASVDAEWGLAPAPAPAATPSPATAATASSPSPGSFTATRPAATPMGSAEPPTMAPPSTPAQGSSAESYSYPDDDWGPPLDEDAPPLEEEPPNDWDSGREAAVAGPVDTSNDPWSRAVEHAPGTWVVGTESNVGRAMAGDYGASTAVLTATPAPKYEPATAQVPARDGLETPRPPAAVAHGNHVPPQAARAAAPNGKAMTTVVEASPARQNGHGDQNGHRGSAARQSLYQRLSNSPEAQAARTPPPTRREHSRAAYVEDIPSADDETIEESGVFGRAAVERILGGKLIEERSLDGTPIARR